MKQKVVNCLLILWLIAITAYIYHEESRHDPPLNIKLEQPEFLLKEPQDGLMECLIYYGVKEPEIVYAQAVLETGHFRSKNCKERNNLFGLVVGDPNSPRFGKYFKFNHWSESVIAYMDKVQYRLKPDEGYYHFLKRIGYAEDEEYISKVKSIVSNIPP